IDAALADQLELRQPLDERRADLRALADQHQRLGIAQPFGEGLDVLNVIVPDRHVVTRQRGEAIERAHRVVIVVENGDFHEWRMVSGEWRIVIAAPTIRYSPFATRAFSQRKTGPLRPG